MKKRSSTLFKTAAIGLSAVATSLIFGMSAACSTSSGSTEKEEDKTTTKVDTQQIKNGNFEFYSDNKGLYPISKPDSWTGGTSGNSSSSMSGVINTGMERWNYYASNELAEKLEANDKLSSGDSDKKDYNGALKDDLPYKNTHDAVKTDATDAQKVFIGNPFTHEYRYEVEEKDGEKVAVYYNSDGEKVEAYKGEDDKWYYKDADGKEQPFETSVLMLHNYRSGSTDFKGTESYYNSSTTITLEASTAAKISVWVKTDELYFDGANAKRTPVDYERGAYIKVKTEVGGNDIDDFTIENINTQKLNPLPTKTVDEKEVPDYASWENNGWVQYTVFVEASNFADTTVTLSLGLGKNSTYTVEGYAFFDDIEFTHYLNSAKMAEENPEFTSQIRDEESDGKKVNVAHPLAPDAKMSFRVDTKTYTTNDADGNLETDKIDKYNSEDKYFAINFASTKDDAITFGGSTGATVAGGLTVDETTAGKFVSSKPANGENFKTAGVGVLANGADVAKLPVDMRGGNGLKVTDDFIITSDITKDWTFPSSVTDTDTAAYLKKTLGTAAELPGANGSASALVMFSARGAAYEAQITDNRFALDDGAHVLISFWLKTSDMDGKTAATIKAVAADDKTNSSSSFSVDSTAQAKVNIGDDKDVYDGWVKCFVRVSNTSKNTEEKKEFKLVINFGNTTISGTTENSYKAGWLAIANMSLTDLDEDVYGYTSGGSHVTTLGFTETTPDTSHKFDTPMGDENVIKTDLAIPSSYTGVYGASRHVDPNTEEMKKDGEFIEDYHETNANDFAGLLNKENFIAGKYKDNSWYSLLTTLKGLNGTDYNDIWNTIFDEYCVQPLVIVNTVKTFDEQAGKIYNYGYIANNDISVSSNGYKAISVRVKASAGAIANVYLVENKSGGKVGSYALPEYNFWYDDDGNILTKKPADNATLDDIKAITAYTLRRDGLYENGDGKLYANFYNLSRYYDISDEHALSNVYDENGNAVSIDNGLIQGEIYYADAAKTAYAPHYLIAGDDANNKVYKYKSGTADGELSYYYLEYKDDTVVANKVVYGVDKQYKRYDIANDDDVKYSFTIDNTDSASPYIDKWVTVTFYVHAGNKSINNYRLELWSGSRDEISSYGDAGSVGRADSYVIFDYSNISLDQSKFDGLRDEYTNAIIGEYKKNAGELENNDGNIADFEREAEEKVTLYDYDATYYTFSLYDATDFRPFNAETAKNGETGYSYTYSENPESLALLKVVDEDNLSMSAFIDYSVVDKDHETIGAPTVSDSTDNSTSTGNKGNDVNVWLLAASIALIVAIFVAIAAIFIRDFVKKHAHKKTSGKNSYNFNKNKRYVKKYVKANGEAPEIAEGELDESLLSDEAPAEVAPPATETETKTEDKPVEEAPAEEPKAEETPAEEPAVEEKPEEAPTPAEEEKPDDGKGE